MASCKLSPTVDVLPIEIHSHDADFVELRARVNIEGLQNYLDKDIDGQDATQYVKVVMLFSMHDPETIKERIVTGGNLTPILTQLDSKKHWEGLHWLDFDSYTYGESVSIDYDRAEFRILVPKELRWEEKSTDGGDEIINQGRTTIDDYLSYFTYIQVNTSGLETDYSIDIPDMYDGMTTDYQTGVLLKEGSLGDNVIDYRESQEDETCPTEETVTPAPTSYTKERMSSIT
tara:strand:+ start:41 stop:733 length:693 start_codon:yes stop_codon:yes gene_type:complete